MARRLPELARGPGWVVVAKPTALAVHRSEMVSSDPRYALDVVRDQLATRVHPIHRLDRAASGCLLFGLEPTAVPALQQALSAEASRKRYIALVRGWTKTTEPVEIRAPIGTEHGPKEAHTTATCLGRSHVPRCSLILAEPHTGRYHQVRRHLRSIDHPIVGDSAHGDTRINRWWRERWGLRRLALHCLALDLVHPEGPIRAFAPVPEDLLRVFRELPFWTDAVTALPALTLPPPQEPPGRVRKRRDTSPPEDPG